MLQFNVIYKSELSSCCERLAHLQLPEKSHRWIHATNIRLCSFYRYLYALQVFNKQWVIWIIKAFL